MNKEIKRLKKSIQFHLPCHHTKRLLGTWLVVMLLTFVAMIVFTFVEEKPVPFEYGNDQRSYIDYTEIYHAYDDYYFVSDGTYTHVYYNDTFDGSATRIDGVPMSMDEDVLEELLPIFKLTYPALEVETVEDMLVYTSEYMIDGTITYPLWLVVICTFMLVLEFIYLLFLLVATRFQNNRFKKELATVVSCHEEDAVLQGLVKPLHRYDSLKVALLEDYFVCNHPAPFVMRYDEISWIYIDKKAIWLGAETDLRIMIYDQHYRPRKVLVASSLWKKNKLEITELFEQLPLMNHQMIVGYNEENIRKFKEKKIGLYEK